MKKIIFLFWFLLLTTSLFSQNLKYFSEEFKLIKNDSNKIVSDKSINDIALKYFNKILL